MSRPIVRYPTNRRDVASPADNASPGNTRVAGLVGTGDGAAKEAQTAASDLMCLTKNSGPRTRLRGGRAA